jgi:hypothetical protein
MCPGRTRVKLRVTRSGKVLGSNSGKESGTILGKNLGNTLKYDSSSDSGKVLGSDSGKESGTISSKNSGKRLGKKSGKELPNRIKLRQGGRARQKCARQGDFFALGKGPFCTSEHQVYTRLIEQGDKAESESNKKGQSELKEEI